MAPVKKAPPKGKTQPDAGPVAKPAPAPRNIAKVLGSKPSRKVTREMLLLETRRFRAMFSEIAERYVANTEGKIASVIDAIEATTLSAKKVAAMLKAVRGLAVKPQKGRRKDLLRIEKAAENLLKALEE